MKTIAALNAALRKLVRSTGFFLRDVGHGALELSHNTLALVGPGGGGHRDLRRQPGRPAPAGRDAGASTGCRPRHEARAEESGDLLVVVGEPDAVARATAADPAHLTQGAGRGGPLAVAPLQGGAGADQRDWCRRPGPSARRARLDPTLILAIMAIESSFNPFAQSPVGAQGLMQVMTRVHDDKYEAFGGTHAAFDPVSNLRVGVQVLKECIQRAGSLEEGLRYYVGGRDCCPTTAATSPRCCSNRAHLQRVAKGQCGGLQRAEHAAAASRDRRRHRRRDARDAGARRAAAASGPLPSALSAARYTRGLRDWR